MMERKSYEKVGTHESVKHEVAEDLALAQEVLKNGGRLFMAYALDLMQTRMYTSWAHIQEGWSKNLHLGSRRVFPKEQRIRRAVAPNFVAVPFLFWLLPPLLLLLEFLGVDSRLAEPAAWATGISALFWSIFVSGIGIPFYWGLAYPIGAVGAAYIALRSTIRGGRKVEWKGRTYSTESPTTGS